MNAKLENKNKREEAEADAEAVAEADEGIQVEPGCGFVLCTGGAKGTDQLAEELARQYGVKVEVVIPPGHLRRHTVTPTPSGADARQPSPRSGQCDTEEKAPHS